mmetsp:Transcript_17368/g.55768  ORF Transcript_17368/g.55768 Transcript_17368/m.55768 type:complete len:294 (+) Transcript_17368:239-1120(+)
MEIRMSSSVDATSFGLLMDWLYTGACDLRGAESSAGGLLRLASAAGGGAAPLAALLRGRPPPPGEGPPALDLAPVLLAPGAPACDIAVSFGACNQDNSEGAGGARGGAIPAHRVVLAASSEYFGGLMWSDLSRSAARAGAGGAPPATALVEAGGRVGEAAAGAFLRWCYSRHLGERIIEKPRRRSHDVYKQDAGGVEGGGWGGGAFGHDKPSVAEEVAAWVALARAAHLQIMGDLLIVCEGRLCAIAASRDTPRDCTMAILSASAEMELWALAEAAGEELSALYPELVGTHAG